MSNSPFSKWMPYKVAKDLKWLRNYAALRTDALTEAAASAVWAKRSFFGILRIDVRNVPSYPRPASPTYP